MSNSEISKHGEGASSNEEAIFETQWTRCAGCNRMFQKYRPNHKYCSDACREKAYNRKYEYKRKEIVTKQCAHCGNEFETNDNKRKYCSKECYDAVNYYEPIPTDKRTCVNCGNEFETTHAHKKYCSKECYKEMQEWYKERRRAKKDAESK